MPDTAPPFRRCHVFIPYSETAAGLESPYYHDDGVRADIASWFAGRPLDWDWIPVTARNLAGAVGNALDAGPAGETVVVNLCDGDDCNGYPGLSVVQALAAAGVPFTGAGTSFYALSTSKLAMKRRFAAAGVHTAPWQAIVDPESDLRRAAEAVSYPMFIKPDVAAAAAGLSSASVVHDHGEALAQVRRLLGGMHGFRIAPGGLFAESFLPGREFSLLVIADAAAPGGVVGFAPCERLFHASLPPEQRFVTYERSSGEYLEDTAPPDGGDSYRYAPVEPRLVPRLQRTAQAAFAALDGTGYGRVDLREDRDGGLAVLEVNANCGLSASDLSTVGAILAFSGTTMAVLLDMMLRDAWRRHSMGERS